MSPSIRCVPHQASALLAYTIWKISSRSRIERSTNYIVTITSHLNMTRRIPEILATSLHPTSMLFRQCYSGYPNSTTVLAFSSTDAFADYFTTPCSDKLFNYTNTTHLWTFFWRFTHADPAARGHMESLRPLKRIQTKRRKHHGARSRYLCTSI